MKKLDLEKRYAEAKNQKNLKKISKEKIRSIVEKCLTEGNIDGNISIINIKSDEFKNLTIERINNRWASCIFILPNVSSLKCLNYRYFFFLYNLKSRAKLHEQSLYLVLNS
ncbi:hypothetical protein SAMN05216351_12322 [Pseudobutyrivibrio sp. JW11]|uniref:hypothetical protein n=1 Tax=Pseudobutyrivibrio sp. JW11 TaxID=1855302 RepID=UPI0008E7796D|nr:hypothetical protein [Pseudobutyrivibrio sp. JW11]SFO65096.1 hypothetical protein SAMN05216351_12322 [Pseudobutyrivibrio sp. JW11]